MSGGERRRGGERPPAAKRSAESSLGDYAALFGLEPRHTLEPSSHARTRRGDTHCETRWFEERDAEARLVARYRTWTNRSNVPPYRTQLGWERFSPRGELLDREVRYSTRASVAGLH